MGAETIAYRIKVFFAIDHELVSAQAVAVGNKRYAFCVANKVPPMQSTMRLEKSLSIYDHE